jgi:Prolyl oligopeptidase family
MKCLVALTWILAFAWVVAAHADTAYRVCAAKGPYFLCDNRVTEDRWLLERFAAPLTKHSGNPLVVKEYDWEGTGPLMGGSVLYDPDDAVYRMWYCVWNSHNYYNKLPFSYNVCYAESNDGIQWRKPSLGVFDREPDSRNNCIRLGQDKTQNIDVCLNPRPDRYPGKFLAIHNQKGGVFVSCSEDGKTFTFLHDAPAIPYHSDTHNNFVYDEVRDRWLLFCRPRAYAGDHKRRVSMQESKDLRNWTHERTILVPSETEKPEFYGMGVFRRGDLFWGVLKVYDRATGFMDAEIVWSGDGEHWSQVATHPRVLERGPEGTWDHGMVLVAESPVIVGDEMRFYYGGTALDHNNTDNPAAIGLATGERDRLVGLRPSGEAAGYVLTRPLLVPDKAELSLNVVVSGSGGTVRAELRDDDNHVLEGFSLDDSDPVDASGYARPMTWRGQPLGAAPSTEVRIRFEVTHAQLFAFDVAAPAPGGDVLPRQEPVQSEQFGATRFDFPMGPSKCFIILPAKDAADGTKPWVWYAPTFIGAHPDPSHAWMARQLLDAGFAICGVDVGESYGNPAGTRAYNAFYGHVRRTYGLDPDPCLLAQSRGGLMLLNWAVDNADHVACVAGIYAVCNLESYPGLQTAGEAYGLDATELRAKLSQYNPVERVNTLVDGQVPQLYIHGDSDTVVPIEKNSGELVRRCRALGGNAELIVIEGKGHEVCLEFFESAEVVRFLLSRGRSLEEPRPESGGLKGQN